MIMAVSSAAYSAGLFHLMTHAFFKALLFMAAGSVIAAMAGMQDLDRMGGFRKAMPFTYGCMLVGGLALSGFPPFSGFFSKDEILAVIGARGDWHVVLMILGYVGSFMTAVYTFRMIFRAFHNDPVPEAVYLMEHGHVIHPEKHLNPVSGEEEDTDVGFPGPEHHIAEREWPMKVAMGVLALGAIGLGVLQIPTVTHVLHDFLHPTFEHSKYYNELEPTHSAIWIGLVIGAAISAAGIALAYLLYVKDRTRPERIRTRFRALHTFYARKWYFDEAIDLLIVRPFAAFGRFARDTFERTVVDGLLVGGSTGIVRAGSAAVRAIQSGFLRAYAALLLLGLAGLALYFLLAAS
jgi:NADH-quinone oxidoreductase subunit L